MHTFVGRTGELDVLARPARRRPGRAAADRPGPGAGRDREDRADRAVPRGSRRSGRRRRTHGPAGERRGGGDAARLRRPGPAGALRGPGGEGPRRGVGAHPRAEPFLAGSRLLELLGELESAGPVLLVVDDLHWADQPSVRALVFALRRLVADQVLVLLAVRDDAVAELPESLRRIVSGHHGAVVRAAGPRRARAAGAGERHWGSRRSPPGPPGGCATGRTATRCTSARYSTRALPAVGGRGKPLPSPRSFRLLVGDRYAACGAETRRPARRRRRAGRPGGTAARGGRRGGHRAGAGRRRGRAARPAGRGHRTPPLDAGVPPPARPLRPSRRTRPRPPHGAAPRRRPARRRRGRGAAPPGRGRPCARTPRSPTTSRGSPTGRRPGSSGRAPRDTSWRPAGCVRTARRAAGGCSSR